MTKQEKVAAELFPFDDTIQRLEHIRLYLGLELEHIEQSLKETKVARLKRLRHLKQEGKTNE